MTAKPGQRHLNPRAHSRFGQRLERRVLRHIQRHSLFSAGERVLVAVSGGPDSTALLLILAHLRQSLDIHLWLAHFDHGLRRRSERQAERAFVSDLASGLDLPCLFGQGDTRALARAERLSLEEAARALRYRFLAQQAEKQGTTSVVTGHTASDQVETVLLHLIRGSGLAGLAGMRPRSPWPFAGHPDLALVRPLLELSRQETERYCQEGGLSPCLDATNLLLEPLRNRVRHELLPLLRRYNPRIDAALLRLVSAASADAAYLAETAQGFWQALARRRERSVEFPRPELAALAPALQSRLLQSACQHLLADSRQAEAVHLHSMVEALAKSGGHRLSLPGGLAFAVDGEVVRLILAEEEPSRPQPIAEAVLNIPGQTLVAGWQVEAEALPREQAQTCPELRRRVGADPYEAFLDHEAVGSHLTVRSRRPGDRFRPLGAGGEQKLQDHLVDAKVPRHQRDAVPLVCAPWGIAWVVGHRLDERAKVREDTRSVLRLKFQRPKA